jgi:hypothetical protein
MRWSIGITTVSERHNDLLPRTVRSLKTAGFPAPRLFVDGARDAVDFCGPDLFQLEVTTRWPVVHTWGNWVLALWEMFTRDPECDRYAIFQDDVVACKNLREFMEASKATDKAYWNLYTHPENHAMRPSEGGWFPSNQLGKGLQGLVMPHAGVLALLSGDGLALRSASTLTLGSTDQPRRWRNADGGVASAFRRAGWTEWCHSPSLLQHVGAQSSMGNRIGHQAVDFKGEDWDACSLLATPSLTPSP